MSGNEREYKWKGWFRLPEDEQAPVPIRVIFFENARGEVSGRMTEPDTSWHLYGRERLPSLESTLSGSRSGDRISLTKIYNNLPGAAPIIYQGEISADERSIEGEWMIGPVLDGAVLYVIAEGPFKLEREWP